jgi:hypothetical protein
MWGGDPRNPQQVGSVDLYNMTQTMREADGTLITMDLSPADVHIPSAMPNYADGFKLEGCVADSVSPPQPVKKQQDKFFQWDKKIAFQPAQSLEEGPGGVIPEVSPTLSNTQYNTNERVLACHMRTETIANADGVLNPDQMAMTLILNKLKIHRERLIATQLTTTGNWDSTVRLALGAGAQWNGGASSDPMANVRAIMRASLQTVTGMTCNRRVWDHFSMNAQVQKFIQFKPSVPGIPTPEAMNGTQALQTLPREIYVSDAKYLTSSGTYDYIWPDALVLFRSIPGMPMDGQTISTAKTFRWLGGNDMVKDSTGVTVDGFQGFNGWLVRKFWDQKRGARGGMTTVVVVNDAELMFSNIVGGLISNLVQ